MNVFVWSKLKKTTNETIKKFYLIEAIWLKLHKKYEKATEADQNNCE